MESTLTAKQITERNNAEEDIIRSTSVIMGKFKFFGELVYRLKTRYTAEGGDLKYKSFNLAQIPNRITND